MFSTITKFNKELEDSVLNLNYSMYIIVFTYLIIPNDFMKLVNKLTIYLPKLPFEIKDYLLYYQVICVLTVVTFVISNFGLINTNTTTQNVIYSLCNIYTCILFIFLIENHSKIPWQNIFHPNNWIINGCIIAIIIFHYIIFVGTLTSIMDHLNNFLRSKNKKIFLYNHFINK